MYVELELANLESTSSEAFLDGFDLVEVRTFDPATGQVEIEYGEGEDRVVRSVSPLRLHVLREGSVADAIVTRGREAASRYYEDLERRTLRERNS